MLVMKTVEIFSSSGFSGSTKALQLFKNVQYVVQGVNQSVTSCGFRTKTMLLKYTKRSEQPKRDILATKNKIKKLYKFN